jgi:hypothetical protein
MTSGVGDLNASTFPGTASDNVAAVLASGSPAITTLFVSMARRHPDGADAQYLQWHTLDHRPEQQRLESIKTSVRAVSTPACRLARAASTPQFAAIDHVMTYFFTAIEGLEDFNALSTALRNAGRSPFILQPVQRGVYTVGEKCTSAHVKLGSDVLPWMPTRGIYLLVEQGSVPASALIAVDGIAGLWSGAAVATPFSTATAGQQVTYCFLDDDPVETALRLRPVLEARWQSQSIQPLLAAPFYSVVPYEWDRYLP